MSLHRTPLLSLAAALALALTTACGIGGGNRVVGTGPLVANERMLVEFDQLVVEAPVNVIVTRGTSRRVTVNAQVDVQPILLTEVKGDRLTISMKGKANADAGTNVAITIPDLEALTVEGAGQLTATDFAGNKLAIETEGSGDVMLRNLRYESIRVEQDGSGTVTLEGSGDELSLTHEGSGDYAGYGYDAREVKVTAEGSGDARVTASSTLKIDLSGSGNVYYRGDPKLELTDKGSGEARSDN